MACHSLDHLISKLRSNAGNAHMLLHSFCVLLFGDFINATTQMSKLVEVLVFNS